MEVTVILDNTSKTVKRAPVIIPAQCFHANSPLVVKIRAQLKYVPVTDQYSHSRRSYHSFACCLTYILRAIDIVVHRQNCLP